MKRVFAAFIFFTRLPIWRWVNVPSQYFSRVVELWPLVGWLTGGVMALTLYLSAMAFPMTVAVLVAVAVRVILTGALHEDGLADFFDGFGGGVNRERILAIMKDSHIGTYGVLGLILYFMLLVSLLTALPLNIACLAILAADPWAKFCSAQIINFLPYSRKSEDAKNKTVYKRFGIMSWIVAFVIAALPALLLPVHLLWAYIAPVLTIAALICLMKAKIKGYTGDCCGASFLLCELSFYLIIGVL